MFSNKATKIDKIFTVDLTLCIKCQIDSEDFVNFCGLLRKHELYEFASWDLSSIEIPLYWNPSISFHKKQAGMV